ncbi:MAG: arsenic resistance protein, partial [Pseudomonadota bacterium]
VIAGHVDVLGLVMLSIFVFFAATYVMAEGMARVFDLPYPEQALLAMTTAARNAPLMLAVTAVAIPDQPVIYAALVIGMLVEFPHLAGLKQVLLAKAARQGQGRIL